MRELEFLTQPFDKAGGVGPFTRQCGPAKPRFLGVETVGHTGKAQVGHDRRLHAIAGPHAGKDERLFDVPHIQHPLPRSGGLLRAIGQHVIALVAVEPQQRGAGCGSTEHRANAVIGETGEPQVTRSDRLGNTAGQFVSGDDCIDQVVTAPPLRSRQFHPGTDDGGSRLNIGRGDEIVYLGRVGSHRVGEHGVDRAGGVARGEYRASAAPTHRAGIRPAQLRGLQRVTRHDRGQSIQDMQPRSLANAGGHRSRSSTGHIVREIGHDRNEICIARGRHPST